MNWNWREDIPVVVLIIFVGLVIYTMFASNEEPRTTTVTTTTRTDTVRVTDTVTVINTVISEVVKFKPVLVQYTDKSEFDSVMVYDKGLVKISGVTYPRIDSISLSAQVLWETEQVFIRDTIKINRVDSIFVEKMVPQQKAWYDSFEFGALSTAIVGVAAILLTK